MTLPSAVKVGHSVYTITYRDDRKLEDQNTAGTCDRQMGNIEVGTRGWDPRHVVETLWHECLHAQLHDSGLVLSDELEEQIVRALSLRQAAFFTDNQELMQAILRILA